MIVSNTSSASQQYIQHSEFVSPLTRVGRITLIVLSYSFVGLFLVIPLGFVFAEALGKGVWVYMQALIDPLALSALKLTLLAAVISVVLNVAFGISSAWLITRFSFKGKNFLLTLIDLPLAISPVIAGMIFVLLYGPRGLLGDFIGSLGIKIIFSPLGIILVTTFVTVPFVARELIPFMQERGSHEEEAALTLGASGWQTFFYVTLPSIKWALLYGIILCNSRAMGEFGAVSVVSGHIQGVTNTLTLHIETLYNGYNFAASFAVASILSLVAIATLIAKRAMLQFSLRRGR